MKTKGQVLYVHIVVAVTQQLVITLENNFSTQKFLLISLEIYRSIKNFTQFTELLKTKSPSIYIIITSNYAIVELTRAGRVFSQRLKRRARWFYQLF